MAGRYLRRGRLLTPRGEGVVLTILFSAALLALAGLLAQP